MIRTAANDPTQANVQPTAFTAAADDLPPESLSVSKLGDGYGEKEWPWPAVTLGRLRQPSGTIIHTHIHLLCFSHWSGAALRQGADRAKLTQDGASVGLPLDNLAAMLPSVLVHKPDLLGRETRVQYGHSM